MTPEGFRRLCARFATGVGIASVLDPNGAPHGLTVNSFTSVSCTPPLVLICVDYSCSILPLFRESSHFGISILDAQQRRLAVRFSRKGRDRFNGVPWTPGSSGVPLVEDALARLECERRQTVEAGDHAVLIAEVVRGEYREGVPLVFFNSAYRELAG